LSMWSAGLTSLLIHKASREKFPKTIWRAPYRYKSS
jgi:hypothetical protein